MSHIEIETFACWSEQKPEICGGTGATSSVFGLHHLRRIMKMHDRSRLPGIPSSRVLSDSETAASSIGVIEITLDTPYGVNAIHIVMDIVDVNILPLLGLDDMDGHGLLADNVTNN